MKRRKTAWKSMILTVLALVWICSATALAEGASGDNSLSSLGILTEGVTVSPEFYYSTIEYNVTVPGGTTRLELEPVTSHENAWIVDITGQDIGENGETTVKITVSAENGSQYAYYLYVTTDASVQAPEAPAAEPETEKETEKQTETEPETEDPRYVKVDRESLQEAENTISALKKETGNYRDRVDLLTKILYGMIGLCVILLFVVINLILKKKDLKAELLEYRGYGYPEDNGSDNRNYEYDGYADQGYDNGSYEDGQGYDNGSYEDGQGYDNGSYEDGQGYDNGSYENSQSYDDGYGKESYGEEPYEEAAPEPSRREKKKAKKVKDDPNTVPKPSKAKKQTKQMPEYQTPEPEHQYQQPKNKRSEKVEINMIDL